MEQRIENKSKSQILSKDKNDILFNMKNILNFINSKDEITYNYIQFNESLFINHNKWLDDIRKEIKEAIKNSEPNINISDMTYDNSLLSLLQKIAKPNNCHNNSQNRDNVNENMNNNEIFEKIDELTNLENLNDMFCSINKCSKYKRDSLYKKDKNENIVNINNKDDLNNEDFEIEYNDKDINMEQFNYDKKNNFEVMNNQVAKDENSLCTIVEIPSVEEREKNSKTSKINKFGSSQFSFSNKNNNINNYINNENNSKVNNDAQDNNNNINICDINTNINDRNCYNQLNINESSVKDHKYNDYSINKINIGDNHSIVNKNYNNKINIPIFTEIKNKDYNPENNNISSKETFHKSNNLISNQKSSNKKEIILSKFDNNINPTQKIELSSLKNKKNDIFIQTSKKKEQIQKNENENSSDKKHINIIDLFHRNYVQKIILSSSKKAMNDMKKSKKEKEKYEDDFEEYEISDSSIIEEDEEKENIYKFVPKWAKDEEYINEKIKKQNNDNDLVKKSFGKFVIENLNLNMILETHIKDFDIRHSTADWRGEDDSLEKNKVTNIKNKEIDDLFPNRKLQFI